MIKYFKCSEVNENAIYEAFKIGFSDYIIQLEMPKDFFIKRFFGAEGNQLENSVIALDDDKPVGLNLGGIKNYEGVKTLRCGALCIHPDYRGTEVAKTLFKLHKEIAIENNCKQLFLEVIVGNDRAINFYKKNGYEKVYDIFYFSHSNPSEINAALQNDLRIEKVDMDVIKTLYPVIQDIHINWQNDFDYISQVEGQAHYGVFKGEKLVGGLVIHTKGKISFLWVSPELSHQGIAKALLNRAVKDLNITKLSINFPNNAKLLGFVKHLNFTRDQISQYEMYKTF